MEIASNTEWAAQRATKISLTVLSLGVVGLAAPALRAQAISEDWQFAAAIYGWFPDIGGHTELPFGGGGSVNVDVSTILDHLKMTAQGSFGIQKGHWGAFTDVIYLDVGESKSRTRNITVGDAPLPAGVTAAADFDLKSTIWTLAGSYRVVSSPEATFDVLAGARLASMKQRLDWEFNGDFGPITPPPRTGSRDASVDQWDAIVGGKGRCTFGSDRKWAVPYYIDVGAGDSDMTWQAALGLTYSFGWGELGVEWRYLDYDLASNGPIRDLNFNGPAAGVAFRW